MVPRDSQDLHKWEGAESAFLAGDKASARVQGWECASRVQGAMNKPVC